LDIKEESKLIFSQLVEWYLELPVVRQNKTIRDIELACRNLEKVFGPMLVKDIKPAMVEKYQNQRLQEPTWCGKIRSAANVNRTIAVLKRMFNLAVREEMVEKNPCWKVQMLPENNVRDRILSVEKIARLLQYLPPHAANVVQFAYLTGMRAGEVFKLTWDEVDLKQCIIRLEPEDNKNSEPRVIYLNDELWVSCSKRGKSGALDITGSLRIRGSL
jgi:integrase